jgi:hypothetical protein
MIRIYPISVENQKLKNHLGGDPMVQTWDQEVCFFCGLKFESCDYSYDGHWRLT